MFFEKFGYHSVVKLSSVTKILGFVPAIMNGVCQKQYPQSGFVVRKYGSARKSGMPVAADGKQVSSQKSYILRAQLKSETARFSLSRSKVAYRHVKHP